MTNLFIVIIGIITIALLFYSLSKNENAALSAVLGTGLAIGCIIAAIREVGDPEPAPIDVYRGRTTIQVTYKDSIPIDTAVVWKEEFKPK